MGRGSSLETLNALHAVGAIGNGEASIKKSVQIYELLFGISLGNYHKTFSEIRAREKDPTRFIDRSKVALLINSRYAKKRPKMNYAALGVDNFW
ncbi:MAG: RteC domain-containing protein, partial [Flavobacteriaceae bacterium]|nr:RteC domain-containing protein [Flavobacteriaceae bacterium]